MKIRTSLIHLRHKYPFNISRLKAAGDSVANVLVELECNGFIGVGEARPSEFYGGETVDSVLDTVAKAADIIGDDLFLIEDISELFLLKFPNSPASIAAIDMALHDIICKQLNIPLYQFLALNPAKTPLTSYTIGIDNLDIMLKKLKEASDMPIIKVKVGFDGDVEMVAAIRDNTDAVLRLDANTGWSVDEAIEKINNLEKYNIEFIEQPIKTGNYEGLAKISKNTNIPIMADEDCTCPQVLPALADCVDSINIKLMKCGGLRRGLKMILAAKSLGLKVMIGCMTESSLSLTAAAHLSPLCDYADLDMHLLITNDPYQGLQTPKGKIILPDKPGIGAMANESS